MRLHTLPPRGPVADTATNGPTIRTYERQVQHWIGLRTNSVRTLIVNVANGREVASGVWNYEHGTQGVILSRDPNLARQHPADYVTGAEKTVRQALASARRNVRGFSPDQVIGLAWTPREARPSPSISGAAAGLSEEVRE